MKYLRNFLGVTILDWEGNQSDRDKLGVRNIVREIEQYQQKQKLVCFIHSFISVTYVTLDTSITDYNLQHNL